MDSRESRAYAKLNLTLEIKEKRQDGYHNLKSVMTHISLFDTIKISRQKEAGVSFVSNAKYLAADDTNLCVKAAHSYFTAAGLNDGVLIELRKVIPTGSGMAGGSADGACVLKLMQSLFGKLEKSEEKRIAESLGADVPFCMTEGTSLCEGVGEIITPLRVYSKPMYFVIAKNARKTSTADAYARLDEKNPFFHGCHEKVIEALERGRVEELVGNMGNSFESVVFETTPQVLSLREKMLTLGALDARLTGAGPCIFGVFENHRGAKKALDALRAEGIYSFLVNIV